MASTVLQFPFALGVDEYVDPKTAPPGTLTTCVNLEWTQEGQLAKRAGTRVLADAGLATIRRIIVRGSELCVTDGKSLLSYSANNAAWTNMGSVPELGVTWRTSLAPVMGVQSSDSGVLANGAIVQAWVAGDPTIPEVSGSGYGKFYYQILDGATGAAIVPPTTASQVGLTQYTARSVRVAVTGNTFVIAAIANAGKVILSCNGGGPVAVRSDAKGQFVSTDVSAFDAQIIGGNTYVAFERSNSGTTLAVYKYTIASIPVEVANTSVAGEVGSNNSSFISYTGISIAGAVGESIYVAYAGSSNTAPNTVAQRVMIAAFNDTLSSQTLARTVLDANHSAERGYRNVSVARIDSGNAAVAYSYRDGNVSDTKGVVSMVVSNTGNTSAWRGFAGTTLLTRPAALNGKFYFALSNDGAFSGNANSGTVTSFLVEQETTDSQTSAFSPSRVVATLEPLTAGEWSVGHVATISPTTAANTAQFVLPFQELASPLQTLWRQGTRLVSITSGSAVPDTLWTSAELMNETHLSGGKYTVYDGRRPFEHGFSYSFLDTASFVTGSNGSLQTNSNYIYASVTEYQSAQGVTYRSPASAEWTQATGSANAVRVGIIPQIEWKRTVASDAAGDPIYAVHYLYRTQANGTVPHRLAISPVGGSTGAIQNDPSTMPNQFWDTIADAAGGTYSLAARPVLYTLGELDDFAPVANLTTRLHKNRLWIVAGDKRTLWVSKDFTSNLGTAPGFNPTQVILFDQDIVGIESMDDKLIVFSATSIWYIVGDGPNSAGDGSFDVVKLQSDTGLVTARSLCSGPMGVIFQSTRGIYLLDRAFSQTWIGKPVKGQLASFPNVTSAVLVPSKNQVRITCNDANNASGVTLVFDYSRNAWSVFKYASNPAIADAALVAGVYTFATYTGVVYQENTSTFLDAGTTFVPWDIESAWISQEGPLGYQRVKKVYLRGEKYTSCDVRVRIAVNDAASYDQDQTFTSGTIDALADQHVLGKTLKTQKNRAFRFRFTDAAPSNGSYGNGRGMTLSAIGFEIVPKGDMDRRAPAATG